MARRKQQPSKTSELQRMLTDVDASIEAHEKQLSDLRALRLKLAESLELVKRTPTELPRAPVVALKVAPRANPDNEIMGWYSHCDRKWY